MPTVKPRIQVTFSQERYDLLKRLAALQGVSMSSVVSELIDAVAEPLSGVLALMEAAKRAPEDVKAGLRASVTAAERDFLPIAQQAIDQFDLFRKEMEGAIAERGGDALSPAPAAGRRTAASAGESAAPSGGAEASQPPFSNTGVRSKTRGGSGESVDASSAASKPKRSKASRGNS